jgi:YfiH family protein
MMRPVADERLGALTGIRHAFFTREGGVSAGIYASLNCGTGSADARELVLENRRRAAETLGIAADKLVTPHQIHGVTAITVTDVWAPGEGPKADAVVTSRRGIALGVGSADCGPILFADAEAGVIGAAHSGWRGALAGVGASCVAAMETLGARRERVIAVLGPTISQANYEVGPEVREKFIAARPGNAGFFIPSQRADHFLFDLPGAIVASLADAGVMASSVGLCTYADAERFFSYRRATHHGEGDYGRLLSAIVLT